MKDLATIKSDLLELLEKISTPKTDGVSIVKTKIGTDVELRSDYDLEEFKFAPGQFVRTICPDCGLHYTVSLAVGVGKGCPDNPEEDNLWFLHGGNDGVTHFCGARKKDFEKAGFEVIEEE